MSYINVQTISRAAWIIAEIVVYSIIGVIAAACVLGYFGWLIGALA